ncbi:MAG TPA: EVE domain-containing protein, partial [Ghiorsea sp.]|nr:EVE domain-containing protein [Ghiorsea sp.]
MSPIDTEGRQIWLRAFYGFNPEEAGYMGFTYEKIRESMLEKMRDGDLVLIYGAVDELTQTDQKAQALGFLEVTNESCMDFERQNPASLAWKKEHGFEDRWKFGVKERWSYYFDQLAARLRWIR